jgi:CHAT domain-containing protein
MLAMAACAERAPAGRWAEDTAAYRVARSLVGSGRFVDAAAEYARVRDSFATVSDSLNQWYGQLWWSETMVRHGSLDTALVALETARGLAGGDPRRLGWIAVVESHAFERRGELDSAMARARSAVEAAGASKDSVLAVYGYDALGTALSRRGRFRDALAADSTSLALRRAIPMGPRVIAGGLNEVGIGYRHLGRYDEATVVLEESYRIAREQHDSLAMAMARGNLASIRFDAGDRAQALEYLTEAGGYAEAVRHRRFMVEAANDLASILLDAGRPAPARVQALRAIDGARATSNRSAEIAGLEHLGRADLAESQPQRARKTLTEALLLADSAGLGASRVSIRVALVGVELALDNPDRARSLSQVAVRIADSLGDPAIQFDALEARGRSLEAARSPDALEAYAAAADLLESLRGRLALGDLRMGVASPRLAAHEGAVRTLLARGRPLEAFEFAERARARLLLELMAERGTRPGGQGVHALRSRLREAYDGRSSTRDAASAAALDREIRALSDSMTRLEAAERGRDPRGFIRNPSALPASEIRDALAEPGRAILAYFWGEDEVTGWWITADTARAVRLGAPDSLVVTAQFLQASLQRPAGDSLWRAAARRAYRQLVAPLAPGDVGEILVIPDGPLSLIPFEVLVPDGQAPLGGSKRIIYGPSGSVMAELARAKPRRWDRAMLAVGNPTLEAASVSRAMPPELRGTDLGPLPHAEAEARALHDMFRTGGADLLVAGRATVERWLDLDPGRYRYLHFALHALASDRHPERGVLLFAGRALDLGTIRRLRLEAELVTLSACETGIGPWIRGEGVVGMQHAFLSAGAGGALVSLWRVADRSAADFVRRFYQEVRAGRRPADALAAVRAEWIAATDDRSHPSRWAAFVLVGDPRAP